MDAEPAVLAEVQAAPGSRLHFSWGLGNEIFCCDTSGAGNEPSTATCVQWGGLSAPQRRIAYDTAHKFVELQEELHRPGSSASRWAAAAAFSRAVSAVLGGGDDAEEAPTVDDITAAQERALWELISLFCIEDPAAAAAAAPPLPDLPKWARSNAAALAGGPAAAPLPPSLLSALQNAAIPESHPLYWPTLARLTALGWVGSALDVLGLHSAWLQWGAQGNSPEVDAQVGVLEAASLLLRRTPSVRGRGPSGGGASTREFDTLEECLTYRTAWQGQCRALLADEAAWDAAEGVARDTAAGVRQVVRILAGEDAAVAAAVATWPELMASRLVHVHPALSSPAELRQLLGEALAARPPATDALTVAAAVLDALCEGEPQVALSAASATCSEWFMAHAPTLLALTPAGAAALGGDLPHLGASQVEFYLLAYAEALAPGAPTWPLAATYFAWCPSYGQGAFSALMERLPLEAGAPGAARKAAAACEAQGAAALAADVRRRQGVAAWQRGLLGDALAWLNAAKDVERVDAALRPLAEGVWGAGGGAAAALAAAADLRQGLDAAPPGSAHHAMVRVKTLLGAGDFGGAVALLGALPAAQRRRCLGAVLAAAPTADPSQLSPEAVMRLMQWLEAGGGDYAAAAVARLALVRLLAASHAARAVAAAES